MKDATGLVHEDAESVLKNLNLARKNLSGTSSDNEEEILKLLHERKEARLTKNFKRSDEIRNRLNELGVIVKDNPDGIATWSYK
jgi:cysteinyl-tRNA synthetase